MRSTGPPWTSASWPRLCRCWLEFEPHQDSEHRRYGTPEWRDGDGRGSYIQSVVAIDDTTPDNGPLIFYPRTSRNGHFDPANVLVLDLEYGQIRRDLRL